MATRKKKKEKDTKKAERLDVDFRLVAGLAADGMLIVDDEGVIVDLNDGAGAMLGYEHDELLDAALAKIDPDFELAGFRESVAGLEPGAVNKDTSFYLSKDGTRIPVELRSGLLPNGNVLILVRDVTEQRAVEEELHYQASILYNIPDPVVSADMNFRVRSWNKAAEKYYGLKAEDVLGQPVGEQLDTQYHDFARGEGTKLLMTEGTFVSRALQRMPDGREFNILASTSLIRDLDGQPTGMVAVNHDISNQLHLEKELQENLARRGHQMELTTQIAQEITGVSELNELYQRVVNRIKERFGYYHVQLLRYDSVRDAVILVFGHGEIGEQMLAMEHSMPLGVGIIGTAAASGESVLVTDLADDPNWMANPLLPDTRGELAIPIRFGDEILGILDIQSNKVGELGAEDRIVLEGLCGQIAIAVENTRLREETEARLRELNHLQRIMSREAWRTFQSAQAIGTQGYLFDRTTVQPVPRERLLISAPVPDGQNGQNGSNGDHGASIEVSADGPLVVTTPLTIRGERIGVLGVQDENANPLSPEERELLESISIQVAESMENARLLEQTQKRAVELETVSRVSAATSTILESEKLLQSVVDLTKYSFNLYHAHVYLLNRDNDELLLGAGAGEVGRIMVEEGWRIPVNSEASWVARAARTRQGVIVGDVTEEGYLPNPLLPATRSELAVPMISGNNLLGVLDVHADVPFYFSDEDLRIHTALASQIAVALQNAQLYEEQLEVAEKLREVERLKSEFLASMSHELRTPLNAIIGFADVMLEGLDGELTPRMEEDVRLIRESGKHLRALIGDVLDMSRIEAGKMELRYEMINMRDLANEVMANARSYAATYNKTHLDLVCNVGPEVDLVEADRTRIRQILYNLVSNAVKFTDQGAVQVDIRQRNENLIVTVQDSGIGIHADHLEMVFEQFRQVDASLTQQGGGTGLGLPITKHLVELHGGRIWVESEVSLGTKFSFTIPRYRSKTKRDTRPLGQR